MNGRKTRVIELKIKSVDDSTGTFEGYGAVFGNEDSYKDVIVNGAFKNFLSTNQAVNVKMLWQHRSDMPIGVYEEISEDENGLFVRGRLLIDDVEKAKEAYALLKAGAISGLSIGYSIRPGGSKLGADGRMYLSDLDVWEISIVTFPANPLANVDSVKSIETVREFENHLRDVCGFSASHAKRIAACGFKAACEDQRDVEAQEAELLKALNQINNLLKG